MQTKKSSLSDLWLVVKCELWIQGYLLELELELDASADPSHATDDNGEESYSLYIYIPFCPLDGDLISV